jgi:hypothetical protein
MTELWWGQHQGSRSWQTSRHAVMIGHCGRGTQLGNSARIMSTCMLLGIRQLPHIF